MNRRRRSILPALFSVACVGLLLQPASSHAGPYYVRVCHADGVNAVFHAAATAGTTAYVQCPEGVNGNGGLVVRNVDDSSPAAAFSHARLTAYAPVGTYFDTIDYTAQAYNNAFWQSGLYDRQNARWLWCGPGCGTLPIWARFSVGGFASMEVELLTICGGSQCRRDGLQGAVKLKDVTLRLQDAWLPGVQIVGGSLVSDGWKRGFQSVEVTASDNAGVQVTARSCRWPGARQVEQRLRRPSNRSMSHLRPPGLAGRYREPSGWSAHDRRAGGRRGRERRVREPHDPGRQHITGPARDARRNGRLARLERIRRVMD